jgi:D-alanyl-lipoteichoic acid acyltransferase DltB (MBOAT superfamily)
MATMVDHGGGRRGSGLRVAIWGGAAALLAAPWVAMQVGTDVHWTRLDFVTWGVMLAAACGAYELAARKTGNRAYRAAMGIAILAAFLLVWINIAVGIIGTERNPANLMFAGVILAETVGAVIARGDARGMARASVATAVAQAIVGVAALVLRSPEGVILSGFFAVLWLVSGALFRKAAGQSVL